MILIRICGWKTIGGVGDEVIYLPYEFRWNLVEFPAFSGKTPDTFVVQG
jgi:hypothetical protein